MSVIDIIKNMALWAIVLLLLGAFMTVAYSGDDSDRRR